MSETRSPEVVWDTNTRRDHAPATDWAMTERAVGKHLTRQGLPDTCRPNRRAGCSEEEEGEEDSISK